MFSKHGSVTKEFIIRLFPALNERQKEVTNYLFYLLFFATVPVWTIDFASSGYFMKSLTVLLVLLLARSISSRAAVALIP
jgi:hypothetical protein